MKASLISILLATAAALVSAAPQPKPFLDGLGELEDLFRRAESTDGTCGGSKGFTCPSSGDKCCSQWGWCGSSSGHCGNGCQTAFGSCDGASPPTNPQTTTTPSTPSPSNPPTNPGGGTRTKPGNLPYGNPIKNCKKQGVIALTFDDGPGVHTSKILDSLNAAGFKATFFINGDNWSGPIDSSPSLAALIKRIINEGHQLASHTWTHPHLNSLSASQQRNEMTRIEEALKPMIGKYPTYMRPPYLECSGTCLTTMNDLGYHVIMEDLDTKDYTYNTPGTNGQAQQIFDSAVNAANVQTGNFNVLMHDVHATTADLLVPHIIETLKAKGWRSVTVGECMNDPEENWYRPSN